MKKIGILCLLGICLLFTGCFNNRQALSENPIIFNETEIDGHWAIENDGKYYFAYSTIKPKGAIGDFNYAFGDCLGYIGDDSNDRIYELSGESSDEWLIKYYVNGEMEIPTILRGISTRYEDYIPESIEEVFEEDKYWIKIEDYIPVEEWTKALKENPWDWANNEDVYPTAWLQTLDTAVGVYPYASFFTSAFNSKDDVFILSFEIYSDDKEIKRFAIYDMDHHKRLFDCFDGGGGGYIQVDESIDIDSVDASSCKEKYDEAIKNLSLTIDIKPEILTIPDGIPSLEQLEDVVAVCHNNTPNCVIDCEDWNITRKSYIIPYKDGYIGYNYGGNGEGRGYGLTYKTFDNPCETIATTDEIFFWHSHYKYNKETFGYDEYPDNKVYINRGLRGGSPTDEVAKVLDCVAGKDMMEDDTCKREVDKYMYNLIVGNEKNEYFTKWMNKFKEDLDNNKFTTTKFWIERHEECYERYKFEDLLQKDGKINSQLTDDERKYYIKLHNENLHECAMEYLNN